MNEPLISPCWHFHQLSRVSAKYFELPKSSTLRLQVIYQTVGRNNVAQVIAQKRYLEKYLCLIFQERRRFLCESMVETYN